ncbi:MAG: hypothetical protein ALECFALPRED_010034 [Alectoria fallacina]|uniref:non-specific serine/threonine protein kinase n=1 Tax=Alectoria fallacina TaxID=1903189 RepID=A0A8H3F197_9LECA|nr:MAG: hypothetical protein ALECFALPRED_010034 [Alectoria fallacina]
MGLFKGLMNVVAPRIDDTEEALQQGWTSITWANRSHRKSAAPQPRPANPVQPGTPQRVETPPPPIPERNPLRPRYTLRIQEIERQHQLEQERQLRENPPVSHQETLDVAQPQLEHRRRPISPSDAEVSRYLRETRPGLRRREISQDCRGDSPTVQEVGSRRVYPAIHRGLHHRQPKHVESNMAGLRRTGYLDVAAASTQRITPHQIFLKSQVKRQQDATDEWARRTGKPAPPYQFEDFIGKGAYGRVFRAVHKVSQEQFAIKVMDADAVDIRASAKYRDESIKEFLHETKILKKLAGAPNVNQIFDITEVEAQLWIISEYVPGGSVKALMQGTGGKLDESYILVIAREVAKGLKAIHNCGIIHRDLKAANVMVHEEGRVQIIDFGVAGMMESKADRRGTIIGTFNWMAPELLKHAKSNLGDDRQAPKGTDFGEEVDVWSYGCTLFEMAKGRPPNSGLVNARQIELMNKRVTPRLKPEEDGFSQRLCDLVAYVLDVNPKRRPSMDDVLQHPYFHDTEKTYPTTTLQQLIRVYEDWASSGGQRQSLIQPSGAAAAEFPEDQKDLGDWRFSVVNIGESAYDNVDNPIPSFHIDTAMDPTMDLELAQREENNLNSLIPESSYTPDASPRLPSNLVDHPDDNIDPTHSITMKTTASEESRIRGVGARFANFFEGGGYSGSEATRPRSDLQLRNDTSESDASQKENKKKSNFRGTPVDTARANESENPGGNPVEQPIDRDARRGTLLQTWDFDSASRPAQEPQHEHAQDPSINPHWNQHHRVPNHSFEDLGAPGDDVEVAGHPFAFPSRPILQHYATAPVEPPMLHNNDTAISRQTLDLDALMNEGLYDYNAPPPEQYSHNALSPQQYDAPAPYQSYANATGSAAMIDTHEFGYNAPTRRNDYHIDAISPTTRAGPEDDQSQFATIIDHPATNGTSSYELTERARGTYDGITHTPIDSFNGSTPDEIARPSPPSAAAMAGDAPVEVVQAELQRLTVAWERALRSAAEFWCDDPAGETDTDEEDDDGGDHTGLDDN